MDAYQPETDGTDHINIYSRARTQAGRMLSNWYEGAPFTLYGVRFSSLECFYFGMLEPDPVQRQRILGMRSKEAKKYGSGLRVRAGDPVRTWSGRLVGFATPEFFAELRTAVEAKLGQNGQVVQALLGTGSLPLVHYYVMFGRPILPRESSPWLVEAYTELREKYRARNVQPHEDGE